MIGELIAPRADISRVQQKPGNYAQNQRGARRLPHPCRPPASAGVCLRGTGAGGERVCLSAEFAGGALLLRRLQGGL